MAAVFPILTVPTIPEPCNQSWEDMPGTTRVRRCAACDQDVVNLAVMSSAEIARLLQGPLPCLRIARYDDGSLVTNEPAVRTSRPRIAAGVLTAAMAIGAAAQQNQQVMVGTLPIPQPQVTGRVTDPAGRPIANATATLLQNGKTIATLKLGPDASYSFTAPAGRYDLRVEAPDSATESLSIALSAQNSLKLPVELAPRHVTMGRFAAATAVTMGVPALAPKATAAKTGQPPAAPGSTLKPKR